ncbi:MAG: DUF4382 domain-containing protein [Bacteroidetes bacterium]|nr:MAG: DUF4382 domain-containing protein [Bacteroidota bacterium]
MKFSNLSNFFLLLLPLLILISCTEDSITQKEQTARVKFKMIDGPGDYEEVNIDIQDVLINWTNDDEGWESIGDVETGIYDLLTLTGGEYALLADEQIPPGYLSQVRILLGENNTVKVDGEVFDLDTPSAQQSGLKILVNTDIVSGVLYNFTFDWDVESSVVKAGNSGKYNLKPVIRVTSEAQSGAISGVVSPSDVMCLVTASNGVDEISTYTNEEGVFLLQGVPEGIYTVTIEPDADSGYGAVQVENVEVNLGSTTDLGTIELQ